VLVGVVMLALLPSRVHPAAITMIVIGVFGALGWWWLPHAHRFADVRPFLLLAIGAYALCFIAPRIGARPIFLALILLLAWLWILGEVVGNDGFSYAPVPTPPPHTMFSLAALHKQADVTIEDLDPEDPLYTTALACDSGNLTACDSLYRIAPDGSDFQQFGAECGQGSSSFVVPGECSSLGGGIDGGGNFGEAPPIVNSPFDDKSLEIGLVSTLFGLAYLAGLFLLDRRGYRGLAVAFVIPCAEALFSGTQSLGTAAHHAWVGGALTLAAGLLFGVVGDRGGRRFTAWLGAVVAAIGLAVIALDLSHSSRNFNGEEVKLIKPGLIVISTGIVLVGVAWILANLLAPKPSLDEGESDEPAAPEPPDGPTSTTGWQPVGAPVAPASSSPEPPSWAAPPAPAPPSALPTDPPSAPSWPPPPTNPGSV
jgi:hypothetical protein